LIVGLPINIKRVVSFGRWLLPLAGISFRLRFDREETLLSTEAGREGGTALKDYECLSLQLSNGGPLVSTFIHTRAGGRAPC